MKNLAYLLLLTISLYSCQNSFQSKKIYRVTVDGVFDLPHWGHQNVIHNARETAAKFFMTSKDNIFVIVGVAGTPKELTSYKRPSVYTQQEKIRQLSGFKGVDLVVRKEMKTTKEFMEKYKIDLVVTGSDYNDPKKREKWYSYPYSIGKFKTFGRTQGVSTSDIMRKTSRSIAVVVKRNKLTDKEKEAVQIYEGLVERYF